MGNPMMGNSMMGNPMMGMMGMMPQGYNDGYNVMMGGRSGSDVGHSDGTRCEKHGRNLLKFNGLPILILQFVHVKLVGF
jgi:hypothetical protein